MFLSKTLLTLAALALSAHAHGTPSKLSIAGTDYAPANGPAKAGDSPWRAVQSGDPVKDESSDAIVCGTNAQTAQGSAKANPGDSMQIWWQAESGGGAWFHTVGPILSYLAECPGDCASFAPSASTKWFKIDEQGLSNGAWAQASLSSGPVTVPLPSTLKAGNYLLRHEIIALQGAQSLGGAEFYPACAQLTVGGDQSGTPDTTVSFPGAYSATDPGIEVDVYTNLQSYVFPGGAVASLGGSSGSGSSGSSSSSSALSSASGTSTGSALPSSTSTSSPGTGAGSTNSSGPTGTGSEGQCGSKKFKLVRRAADGGGAQGAKKRHAARMQRKRSSGAAAMRVDVGVASL